MSPDQLRRLLVETLRQHLAGRKVRVPEAGRLLWSWFKELHAARAYGMGGPEPIGFTEIEAYARLNRIPMEPRHVALIRALDDAFREHANRDVSALPKVSTGSGQAMTPAAFDVVFR